MALKRWNRHLAFLGSRVQVRVMTPEPLSQNSLKTLESPFTVLGSGPPLNPSKKWRLNGLMPIQRSQGHYLGSREPKSQGQYTNELYRFRGEGSPPP